jgi:hypothetical protein
MSGWTVVDTATNKSVPVGGTQSSGTPGGAGVAYTTPAPSSVDPVGKLRVSQPQSLIDTDFEYGPQPTKWESIALQNNRATAYYIPQSPLVITSITGLGTSATPLTITGTFVIPAGSIIYIQNAIDANANGWGFTASGGTNTMTVVMSTTSAAGEKFNTAGTYVYLGYFYSGSGFRLATTTAFTAAGGTIVGCNTATAHGLSVGSLIYVVGTTSTGVSINGPQIVNAVAGPTNFQFSNVNGAPAGATFTNSVGQTNLYARSAGFVESRPYDGGVAFSASSVGVAQQLIRQTRRYFRYQSGKGIQFSTGTSLCPSLFVTSITSSTSTATVTTRFAHNLSVGAVVQVQGCNPGFYNGRFTIATTPTPTTFTYSLGSTVGTTTATGFPMRVSPVNWYGASNRAGMFDQQNGMFFEYDGQQLYAVWRSSVLQLNGTVTVTNGSGTVTGVGTQFNTQLIPGDFIVIRGQTYRVVTIDTSTSLSISPEYRGTTITSPSYALVSKTVDTRIPQSQWNLDKCNGTGPSGYNIDLTRMQMLYMDYSWYGAGVIRWGVRATNGQVIYCHQQQNNNQQFEAYLRSGNMPAHYESNGIVGYTATTFPPGTSAFYGSSSGNLTTTATSPNATTIIFNTTNLFQTGGGVAKIESGSNIEYIYYGGVNPAGNALINCIRGIAAGRPPRSWPSGVIVYPDAIPVVSADQFNPNGGTIILTNPTFNSVERYTYTGIYKNNIYGLNGGNGVTTPASGLMGVEFAAPDTAAPLAHWGSSVIMDGLFDDDKSLVFNFGTTSTISLNAGTTVPIMAIRVAPTADNGTTGLLGIKETINRMQLQLNDMAVVSSGAILVNLILNGTCTGFSGSFQSIAASGQISSSLAQVAVNTTNTATITGGESVTALYSNGVNTLDLGQVRDLGNSILGGGTVNTIPTTPAGVYPDGPDILYVVATNTTASAVTMLARINWKEAQA